MYMTALGTRPPGCIPGAGRLASPAPLPAAASRSCPWGRGTTPARKAALFLLVLCGPALLRPPLGTAFSQESDGGKVLICSEDLRNLDNWDSFTGEVAFRDGALLLGTSRDGIVLRKDVPPNLLVQFKAKSLIWKEGTFGCGFRVLLRVRETVKGTDKTLPKHDFYDIQFHPTPDVPNWGGYRHILVFKQFAGKKKDMARSILERRWTEGKAGEWYDVRILIRGNTITAWLDGDEVFTVTDAENAFPAGRIGIAGFRWGNHAYFKGLKLWAVQDRGD